MTLTTSGPVDVAAAWASAVESPPPAPPTNDSPAPAPKPAVSKPAVSAPAPKPALVTSDSTVHALMVDAFTLKSAMSSLKDAITRHSGLAALASVRFETVGLRTTVTATDLDTTISVKLPTAHASTPGVVLVNHSSLTKLLADVKKADSCHVQIIAGADGAATVKVANDSSAALTGPLDADYPSLPEVKAKGSYEIDIATLVEVAAVASTDQTRPILTGVLLHNLGDGSAAVVATDSYRMAIVRGLAPVKSPRDSILFPAGVVKLLAKTKATTATMEWSDLHVRFTIGDVTVTTRLIEGEFPNYRGLVPTKFNGGFVIDDAAAFAAAAKYLLRFGNLLNLTTDGKGLVLTHTDHDAGTFTRSFAGRLDGFPAEFKLGLNGAFAQSLVADAEGTVTIQCVDGLKPMVVTTPLPGGAERVRLLMPIRV